MYNGVRKLFNPSGGLQNTKLVDIVTRLLAEFMNNRLPGRLVELDMSAKLQVLTYFFMEMQHNFWFAKIGTYNVRACGVVVLSGFGMDMRHSSMLPPNAVGVGPVPPREPVIALSGGKERVVLHLNWRQAIGFIADKLVVNTI